MPDPCQGEDDLIAYILIQIQTLTTGRTLRAGVAPADLNGDELIKFWIDPQTDLEVS